MERLTEEIRSLNAILAELKGALDILCGVGRGAKSGSVFSGACPYGPAFSCSFICTREEVGISAERLCILVKLTRNTTDSERGKLAPLEKGWSLVSSSVSGDRAVSKSVPITALACGDSVTLRIDAAACGEVGQLGGAVKCFIHYDPHHLLEHLQSKKSLAFSIISLFLASREFDILDYLQPQGSNLYRRTLSSLRLQTVKSTISSDGESKESNLPSPPSLLHTASLNIAVKTAVRIIQQSSPSSSVEELLGSNIETISARLLRALLPAAHSTPPIRERPGEILMGLDGEGVKFKLSCATEVSSSAVRDCAVLKLEIRASSERCLTLVVSAVNRRRRSAMSGSIDPLPHEEVCVELERLELLLKEVAEVEREMSAHWQERRTNCISAEEYCKALHSWQAKMVSIYCKLRE